MDIQVALISSSSTPERRSTPQRSPSPASSGRTRYSSPERRNTPPRSPSPVFSFRSRYSSPERRNTPPRSPSPTFSWPSRSSSPERDNGQPLLFRRPGDPEGHWRELAPAEQNAQQFEFEAEPPRQAQREAYGDFYFHEGENVMPHVNFPPPNQLDIPSPIFRSSYRSGACPFWRSEENHTSISISPRCEDCLENYIIIRQNNTNEIQLNISEFYAMYDCIRGHFASRN